VSLLLTPLRFDDTNPDAEEKIYFDAIEEVVRWLGENPIPSYSTITVTLTYNPFPRPPLQVSNPVQ
jgi:hypothetical protein